MERLNNKTEHELLLLYRNITKTLEQLKNDKESSEPYYNDNSNAWMYILFVLTFYAFSIVVLMVKYIKREREGSKLEFYYNEFVKREWYKDKNLYDNRGRRIQYNEDGCKIIAAERRVSRCLDDPDLFLVSDNEELVKGFDEFEPTTGVSKTKEDTDEKSSHKKSVVLCLGTASTMGMVSMGEKDPEQGYENTGARPKRSALKNWPLPVDDVIGGEDLFPTSILRPFPPKLCVNSFHQQSLDEALEMRNLTLDEEREFAQMRSRSKLFRPLMLRPKAAITLEEDESSARVSDEDSSTDSITDAFDFVPNRAKLAFCKVDETMQQVPPLLAKASNGRPGLNRCSVNLKPGQSVLSDDSSLNSVPVSDETTGAGETPSSIGKRD